MKIDRITQSERTAWAAGLFGVMVLSFVFAVAQLDQLDRRVIVIESRLTRTPAEVYGLVEQVQGDVRALALRLDECELERGYVPGDRQQHGRRDE